LSRFGCVPLNANELLLPAQRAELQELLSVCLAAPITASRRHTLKCQKLFCLLCLNRSQTKMERLNT